MPILAPRDLYESSSRSADRLRILHAVFSSRLAGSERYCVDLANRQAALGHEVHVAGAVGSPISAALSPLVRFHPVGRCLRGLRLRRLAAKLGVDVCHGHLSAACKGLGRLRGSIPAVATLHVGYKPHQHGRMDGLICVNHAQAARIADYSGTVRTIPNWVPQSEPLPVPAAGLRAALGIDENTLVIGSVGRLHESKGPDVLIAAFRAAALPNAVLLLVGEGPQRAELERQCAGDPRIRLLGYRSDIPACLQAFDLFVSPSREESFGLAIIEAMNVGLPVIATATEGPAEYFQDHPITLVAPGDAAALAAALDTTALSLRSGELPPPVYDLSFFAPDRRVDDIMDLYRQVRGARRPASVPTLVAAATVS